MSNPGNIWRPSVRPNEMPLPAPGSSRVQDHYTRTSLVANSSDRESQLRQSLNQQIIAASQAYNDTPKPFSRAQQPVAGFDRQVTPAPNRGNVQDDEMSPRLVHKQYNSPIDLYSMNNIRKTIEAHTEMIAPGLKGINFKKHEAPINKESEVYKLIKEEEQQKHNKSIGQVSSARLSPISGQPIKMPSGLAEHKEVHGSQMSLQNSSSLQTEHSLKSCSLSMSSSSVNQQQQQNHEQIGRPKCFECGQFIVGPFAKIQNRCVHPQCFNCTTCGSSLKNTGHFIINEKLYCDIHAKQVAKMMRIQYNFEENHRQQQQQQTPDQTNRALYSSNDHTTGTKSAATISTMFSNMTQTETEGQNFDKKEIQWAWRPVTSKDSSTIINVTRSESSISDQRINQQSGEQLSRQVSSQSNKLDRGTVREDYIMGCSRVPICMHCHVQIQGPYLMAGKTTWCKLCSQSHFNCSSCHRSLLETGFVEDNQHKYYCENCYEAYYAPICSKCNLRIKGDCLNALGKQWHPSCFVCGHCRRPFGNSSFYLEDNVPYCERDWNLLFTTKCYACSYPIEAGDKWILALDRNYHSNCFKCSSCQSNLEGSTFYCKNGKPYCRLHAR